jgi:dimethylhistidine N-methyltransferase
LLESADRPHPDRFRLIARPADVELPSFAEEVRNGLSAKSRSLPCRFFYDHAGSKIFEEICGLDEYYLTRAERSILQTHARALSERFDEDIDLVELGSGSAEKTRLLIESFLAKQRRLVYVPIDISRTALEESSESLLLDHPRLEVHAICGEYEAGLSILNDRRTTPRLILWLGSSIGNLHKPEAQDFLAQIHSMMGKTDRMLIGIDLRKDRERLERAYDDSRGVTARFNLNLLLRINRELGGEFRPDQFEFRARYREDSGSVESSLVSLCDQDVAIGALGASFHFHRGEEIHTENSYKYSFEEIDTLADKGNMHCEARWLDKDGLYSLNLFSPRLGLGGS